jgi:hypothetical protein
LVRLDSPIAWQMAIAREPGDSFPYLQQMHCII